MRTFMSEPPPPASRSNALRPGTTGGRVVRGPVPLGAAKILRTPPGRIVDPSRRRGGSIDSLEKPLHEQLLDIADSISPSSNSGENSKWKSSEVTRSHDSAWMYVGGKRSPGLQLDPIRMPRMSRQKAQIRAATKGPVRGSSFHGSRLQQEAGIY